MCRHLRSFAVFTVLLLLSAVGVVLGAESASATSTILCTGYDGCARMGLGNAGYKQANGKMYWLMYSGHNCTNYAAYRMVRSGLPTSRPWKGNGNASNWGHARADLTDGTPSVGAVAWWDRNVRPAGSAGHVAYVEQVISATEIVVSQDSWGGDFSWARITRAGGSWPSGFVHFKDIALTSAVPPTVTGTPKVGGRLTAGTGTWSQTGLSYGYTWYADGLPVAGATAARLKLTPALEGKQINVRVTVSKTGYLAASADSAPTAAVGPAALASTGAPTVGGDPTVDATLTATPGTWNVAKPALRYQWSADGTPVDGATGRTFTPGPDQVGKALAVAVTAAKRGYQPVTAPSSATDPVAPGTFAVTAPPTLRYSAPGGVVRPGETITVTPPRTSPADGAVAVQWMRGHLPIEGSTGSTYTVTPADLGSRISARVTVTKPGYTARTDGTARSAVTRAATALAMDASSPRRGRVRVVVRATAPGVEQVPGVVQVRFRGRLLQELTLRRGAAGATLTGLPSGARTITVRYVRARSFSHAALRRTVVVR